MISVSRKDWANRSVPGLEMEETELEEGEAFNCHEGFDDSSVDPDITSLSYIDEKIQSVLGHFQKDFDGGVSAENLGAKFGGYGSFLPTHQRSPSWSHLRSPAEVVHNSQRSPKNVNQTDQHNSLALARPPMRSSTPSGKAISTEHSSAGRGKLQSGHSDKLNVKIESGEKSVNHLKLRIKVGTENLSMQKNVDIYSGLGLESLSSSIDGSRSTSEGQDANILDIPDESPTSILQMMTSFPGDALLSPLSEDLIHLSRKLSGKKETRNIAKACKSMEKSDMLMNDLHSSKRREKVPEAKRLKAFEKLGVSAFEKAEQTNGSEDKTFLPLQKENEAYVDSLVCEEISSNALKLPLLSSTEYSNADPGNDLRIDTNFPVANIKDGVSGETSSYISAQDVGRVEKSVRSVGLLKNVSEHKKRKHLGTNAASPLIDIQMAVVSHALDVSELIESKAERACSAAETSDQTKQFVFHNGRPAGCEDFRHSLVSSPNGNEKRPKVAKTPGSQGAYSRLDPSAFESSINKHEKISDSYTEAHKKDLQEPKKGLEKRADRYKDFFGVEEFEDEEEDDDDESLSGEGTFAGRLNDHHLSGKTRFSNDCSILMENCNRKDSGNHRSEEKHPRIASHVATLVNGPSTEASTGLQPMVNENWVSCDLCQIWRLLPLETDPKSLPEKWTCSMLTWLPGMNHCFIPEDKTTNALRALYHPAVTVPAHISESQHMGIAVVAAGYPDQDNPSVVVRTATNNGKTNLVSMKATNSTGFDGSTRSSSSRKKSFYPTGKESNLTSGNSSPSPDACRSQLPASSGAEKFENNKRKISASGCSDRGALRSKQEAGMEGPRASHRIKSEELYFDNDKWITNNAGSPFKGGNASTIFSNNTSENEGRRNRNRTDSSMDKKDLLSDMNLEAIGHTTANNASVHSGKCEEKDILQKRKAKELCFSDIHSDREENESFKKRKAKEHRYPDIHSEKRAGHSKSTKGSSVIKSSVAPDQKSEGPHDELHMLYVDNNQVSDFLKSDVGRLHAPVAANSSSSKVSSHKIKIGGQEVKSSPVESVSSSPLRHPDAYKVSSMVKNLIRKFDIEDCGSLTAVSPRRLSSDGGCNVETGMKRKTDTGKSLDTGFHTKKSAKGSSSYSKGTAACGRDVDKDTNRASDSSHNSLDKRHMNREKSKSQRNKFDDKSGTTSKGEKFIKRKDTVGGTPNENGKTQASMRLIDDVQDGKKLVISREHDFEKASQKSNGNEHHGNVKSNALPPFARVSTETTATREAVSGSQKDRCVNVSPADAFDSVNVQKTQTQKSKAEKSNGSPRLPTPNSHKVRDADAPSPVRREYSNQTANALKEAKDLKHTADRMKNAGSPESYGLYFQSALKFLHGASLLESGGSEAVKQNELMQSIVMYRSTAQLFDYCAREYEKLKDMAAAALAYKCVEVAYMRVVYFSHSSANRDRNELQSALQIVPLGESPSSSASDIDNLNHQAAPEKGALARVVGSPHVSGNHAITSRNRAGFSRILNFAHDVNTAMDASRKSRHALAAAMSHFCETSNEEVVSSLKKALDYTFQDVEGLLRLVRVAMEAISR